MNEDNGSRIIHDSEGVAEAIAEVTSEAVAKVAEILGYEVALVSIVVPTEGGKLRFMTNVEPALMEHIIQHAAVEGLLNGAVNHFNILLPIVAGLGEATIQ